MKKCYTCKIEKDLSMFYKDKNKKCGISGECKDCSKKYSAEYRLRNLEYFKEYGLKYRSELIIDKEYFKNYSKEYYQTVLKEKRKLKKLEDPVYKLKLTLQSRTSYFFKHKKFKKSSTYDDIFGDTYDNIKMFISSKFIEGMSWDNHGFNGWHIDHIIPLCSAKTEEDLYKLCHYTNLQPLWAEDNWKKGYKLE